MSGISPTDEQLACLDAAKKHRVTRILALAGTGKTTTMTQLASGLPGRGIYLAFNRAIVRDSREAMLKMCVEPPECLTFDAAAVASVDAYLRERLTQPIDPAQRIAETLNVQNLQINDKTFITSIEQVKLAQLALDRYARSLSPEISPQLHVLLPSKFGYYDYADKAEIQSNVADIARRIWSDIRSPSGHFRCTHNMIMKIWDLEETKLPVDYILFDEAQDATAVMMSIIKRHADKPVVICGDRYQNLYRDLRPTVDALSDTVLRADAECTLSKSFRFGPAIADQANEFLRHLQSPILISPNEQIRSTIGPVEIPDCVIFNRRLDMYQYALASPAAGRSNMHFSGGESPTILMLKDLARAQIDHRSYGRVTQGQFTQFEDPRSGVVREILLDADNASGTGDNTTSDVESSLKAIDEFSPESIHALLAEIQVDPKRALLHLGTIWTAKGSQWNSVRLKRVRSAESASRILNPKSRQMELMKGYVAVTRARLNLDWSDSAS